MSRLNTKPNFRTAIDTLPMAASGNGNVQPIKPSYQKVFEGITSLIYGRDSFYEKADVRLANYEAALNAVMAEKTEDAYRFLRNVVYFTRTELHMRTLPIVTIVMIARAARSLEVSFPRLERLVGDVVSRADELTDMYAYALTVFGEKKRVPNAIKRGLAFAYNKFDAYQLAKYNRDGAVKQKDVVRITHPAPKDETQSEILKKLLEDALEAPDTWEVALTRHGQAGGEKTKGQVWEELVAVRGKGQLGYMALLRNPRNIAKAGVSQATVDIVASRIADPNEVAKSKQLPWAFVNAYDAFNAVTDSTLSMKQQAQVLDAIKTAMDLALGNMPSLGERVVIVLDVSGSMGGGYDRGTNTPAKLGSVFSAALYKAAVAADAKRCDVILFSDNAELMKLNPSDRSMDVFTKIFAKSYGGGTNMAAAGRLISQLDYKPDCVIVISDMEVNAGTGYYGGLKASDLNSVPKDALKIAFNMQTSQTTPLADRAGWYQLAGFSDNIFRWVDLRTQGDSIVKMLTQAEFGV